MASKGRKLLFGCGFGCGALLLLGIGSCVGFSMWIDRPGELLEPERLFDTTATGYLEWTLSDDDPGTGAFMDAMFDQGNRGRPANLPGILDRVFARGQAKNRDQMRELLPVVAVWTLHAGAEGEDDLHVLGLGVERLGNRISFMDWMLGMMFRFSDDVKTVHYGGERVYQVAEGGERATFFIHEQNVFITSDLEAAKRALDRMREPPVATSLSEIGGVIEGMSGSAMRGAMSNATGSVETLWEGITGDHEGVRDRLDWDRIRLVTVRGGFTGASAFAGVIELHTTDAEWAATHATAFVDALRADYRQRHLPIETEVTVEGKRVIVDVRLVDVPAFLDELD